MGAPMSRLLAALAWSGRDTMLSLFVAFPRDGSRRLLQPNGVSTPRTVRIYEMENLDDRLPRLSFVEYDLTYDDPPSDLDLVVRGWLQAAVSAGASLAWFGFEGSFDLEHLLSPEVADQVYAVATAEGEELALDDERREGPDWPVSLGAARRSSGL